MPAVVSCTCGAKIKLPESRFGSGFSLPSVQGRADRGRRRPDRHVVTGRSAQPGRDLPDLSVADRAQ